MSFCSACVSTLRVSLLFSEQQKRSYLRGNAGLHLHRSSQGTQERGSKLDPRQIFEERCL